MSLQSENLIFRAIEDADLPIMLTWINDPEAIQYFYNDEPISLPMQKKWFENYLKNIETDKIFIIEEKKFKTAIGMVSIYHIDWRNKKAEWGRFFLEKSFRGKGYGKEIERKIYDYCFTFLNLNKLYCEVFEFNTKVIDSHKKMGSCVEGILRQHVFKNGKYQNVVVMSILLDEYKKQYENT